jgi:hypothetical protein
VLSYTRSIFYDKFSVFSLRFSSHFRLILHLDPNSDMYPEANRIRIQCGSGSETLVFPLSCKETVEKITACLQVFLFSCHVALFGSFFLLGNFLKSVPGTGILRSRSKSRKEPLSFCVARSIPVTLCGVGADSDAYSLSSGSTCTGTGTVYCRFLINAVMPLIPAPKAKEVAIL